MATFPSFRAPASRRLLPRSCGESRRRGRAAGLPAEGDLPRTPCPERSPAPSHRAAGRAAGGGGDVKPGEPDADRSRGPETSGATTPTRRAGHPGPGAGHPPGGRLPLPRGRRRRGRAGSRQQPGPPPGGPRGRQVDCLQADRGASECVWGSVCAGCSRWKPCLHVSAGRFPFLLVLLLPGFRRSGAAGSSGLTGRPRRSSAGASFSRPVRAAPHARLPRSAPGLPPASRRGSRACGAAPPKVSGPEPAARTTGYYPPAPSLTPRLAPGSTLPSAAQRDG